MQWKRILIGTWSWKRPLYSLAFIYGSLCLFALIAGERMMFHPTPPGYARTDREITLVTSARGDTIAVYHRPAAPGMPTLLLSHGNAEDLTGSLAIATAWTNAGFGIAAYDYPGYGHSSGKPSEQGSYAAIDAAWLHLTTTTRVAPDQIVLVGRSLGSGPTLYLAAHQKPAGVILLSPFVSAFRSVTKYPLLPGDKFPNLHRIRALRQPLLVMHGDADRIISCWHGRTLVDACPAADKQYLQTPGAGHDDLCIVAEAQVNEAVATFAKRVSTSAH